MDYTGFTAELKKNIIKPIYLFYGSEEYLKRKAIQLMRSGIAGDSDMDISVLDGAGADEVIRACETLPMFSAKRLVLAMNCDNFFAGRQKAEENKKLAKYLIPETFPPHTCLAFITNVEQEPKNDVCGAVKKSGCLVELTTPDDRQLILWLKKNTSCGANIGDTAARLLLDTSGKELIVLQNEIEKLSAYARNREITCDDIRKMAARNLDTDVFKMAAAFLEGKPGQGMEILQLLLREGQEPQSILGVLALKLRELFRAKAYLEQGMDENAAVAAMGGSRYFAQMAVKLSRKYATSKLSFALQRLADMDHAVKTGRAQQVTGLETALLEVFS